MSAQVVELTPHQVRDGVAAGQLLLIDVREPNEQRQERIPGALLSPLSTFDPSALADAEAREIVLHCAGGRRSATAVARCLAAGVPVTAHLAGGLGAWKAAGLPLHRG